MAAAQVVENHGDEWGLTWYLPWGLYTSFLTWTCLPNSLAASGAPSLNISSNSPLSNNHEDHLNHHKNSNKLRNETRHPIMDLMGSQWKLRQQHDWNFPMEWKPLQNQYWCQKKKIQKNSNVRITVWDVSRKVNYLNKATWDGKIITELTRSITSTKIG